MSLRQEWGKRRVLGFLVSRKQGETPQSRSVSISESGEKGLGEMRAPGLSVDLCLEQLLCALEKAMEAHV